ncbi:MAG: hypothetical protein PHE83_15520, partial [Opitutaceae bacterium]|nr:hypothetical protein [Opitutaceae bacterium]
MGTDKTKARHSVLIRVIRVIRGWFGIERIWVNHRGTRGFGITAVRPFSETALGKSGALARTAGHNAVSDAKVGACTRRHEPQRRLH